MIRWLLKSLVIVNVYKSIANMADAVGLYIIICFQLSTLAHGQRGESSQDSQQNLRP